MVDFIAFAARLVSGFRAMGSDVIVVAEFGDKIDALATAFSEQR